MSDPTEQPQSQKPSDQGEVDEQRQDHLSVLGKSAKDVPDMADPQQWRDAPKEGGGA